MGLAAPTGVLASGQPVQGDRANAVVSGTFGAVGPGKAFGFLGPFNISLYGAYVTTLTTTAGSANATVGTAGAIAAGAAIKGANVPPGTTVKSISGTSVVLAFPAISLQGLCSSGVAEIWNLPSTANILGATITSPYFPANTTVASILQAAVPATTTTRAVAGIVTTSAAATSGPVPINPPPWFDFALAANSVKAGADAAAIFTSAAIEFTGTIQLERSFDGGSIWTVDSFGVDGALAQWDTGTPVNVTVSEPEGNVLYRLNCTAYTGVTGVTLNYRISDMGAAATSFGLGPAI